MKKHLPFILSLVFPFQVNAVTDIATAPLVTSSTLNVKPNILLMVDDSGSMGWNFLPDTTSAFSGKYGAASAQCNGVYYDPLINYTPPVNADGSFFPNSNFNSAWNDGYNPNNGITNLNTLFQAAGFSQGSAFYFQYHGNQTGEAQKTYFDTTSVFYKECRSTAPNPAGPTGGNTPGKNVFTYIKVSSTSGPNGTDERQNFANWYSYYRTRINTMKTMTGKSFVHINDQYRVGYATMNNNNGTDFLNVNPFTQQQKTDWYQKLYNTKPGKSTPLLKALAESGKLYANKLSGNTFNGVAVNDPVEYSCQNNYTILSTDGYWNSITGGTKIDGTMVGDQDSNEKRPMKDGSATSNTLADVAEYYYITDLRTPALGNCQSGANADVCNNNVPTNENDSASWQHMTTFTLSLGARGRMLFSPTYKTDTQGDYISILNGVIANPTGGICSWKTSGSICDWPIPKQSGTPENIDDLWHAAVNGRGTYFNANNPTGLSTALTGALLNVSARTGASSAATTSNPNVTTGDNFVFNSTFVSQEWSGDIKRQQLDLNTGKIVTVVDPVTGKINEKIDWSAKEQLDSADWSTRTVYTFSNTSPNNLIPFSTTNFSGDTRFTRPWIDSLTQFCATGVTCLSETDKTNASGSELIQFLLGDKSHEGTSDNLTTWFRPRTHLLGDIVNSEAVYIRGSKFSYGDFGYTSFKASNNNRSAMVYVGGNDGMLHAFDANTGTEKWAYIPSILLKELYKLADKNYSIQHQFYVDGSPIVGDICAQNCQTDSAVWKTILVGGLNAGGRGYYALDITDPATPKALWEFTHPNLGLTYGNPVITKLNDGTWVTLFSSGYNNVNPGNGVGTLYVVNALTGQLQNNIGSGGIISTNIGTISNPSGLGPIAAQVQDPEINNTILAVYAGDSLGNLWRFDINNTIGNPGYDAQLIATLVDSQGKTQPITTRPEIGIRDSYTLIFVGTGKYLGMSDITDNSTQSIYGIVDPLSGTPLNTAIYPDIRNNGLVEQTITSSVCSQTDSVCAAGQSTKTNSNNPVDLSINHGWFLDLPDSGERINTDPTLQLGTLGVTSNTPNSDACTIGGVSYGYFFNFWNGNSINSNKNNIAGVKLGNSLSTRPVFIRLPNNTVMEIARLSDGTTAVIPVQIENENATVRKINYREIIND